ncbi:hypothetical protein [uncultured Roseobacter sp.]|uniref:hypothetical protein n=1 Tax=uncultured Roseobacter sp. TaxID=114847 RepID=UPI00262877E7|nr:hypothetical protein [uncultured Roseobacter sp.]
MHQKRTPQGRLDRANSDIADLIKAINQLRAEGTQRAFTIHHNNCERIVKRRYVFIRLIAKWIAGTAHLVASPDDCILLSNCCPEENEMSNHESHWTVILIEKLILVRCSIDYVSPPKMDLGATAANWRFVRKL